MRCLRLTSEMALYARVRSYEPLHGEVIYNWTNAIKLIEAKFVSLISPNHGQCQGSNKQKVQTI